MSSQKMELAKVKDHFMGWRLGMYVQVATKHCSQFVINTMAVYSVSLRHPCMQTLIVGCKACTQSTVSVSRMQVGHMSPLWCSGTLPGCCCGEAQPKSTRLLSTLRRVWRQLTHRSSTDQLGGYNLWLQYGGRGQPGQGHHRWCT